MKLLGVAVFAIVLTAALAAQQAQQSAPQVAKPSADEAVGATRVQGNVEVLSDTKGVDFGPYLSKVLKTIRTNWYALMPAKAKTPELTSGKVSIEFAILPDGKVADMRIISPSGDVSLDRAAWGGITASNSFSPLPSEFHGPYLALRFHFQYNPEKAVPIGSNREPDTPAATQDANTLFANASSALSMHDYAVAIPLAIRLTEMYPQHNGAWNLLGLCYLELDELQKAEDAFKRQIDVSPQSPFAYNNLGRVYARKRNYDMAIAQFRKQIEINPRDRYAHMNLAESLRSGKKCDQATSEYQLAAELTPENAGPHVGLARCYLDLGQQDSGIAELDKAAALTSSGPGWDALAWTMAKHQIQLDRAEQYARLAVSMDSSPLTAVSLDPLTPGAYGRTRALSAAWDILGWILFLRGDFTSAEKYIMASWTLSRSPTVSDHLAQLAEKLGRKDDAVKYSTLAVAGGQASEAQDSDGDAVSNSKARLVRLAPSSTASNQISQYGQQWLQQQDSFVLPNPAKHAGSAEFSLLRTHGQSSAKARWMAGDQTLKDFESEVAARMPAGPADVGDIDVLRWGTLSCEKSYTECKFRLSSAHEAVNAQLRSTVKPATAATDSGGAATSPTLGSTLPPSKSDNPPEHVQVAQGTSQGMLISKVQPSYPPLARQARVQGTVVLHAVIGKDGSVQNLTVISGHPMLTQAALDAVKQWRYKTYLLDGEPVLVETTINVNFALSGAPSETQPTASPAASTPQDVGSHPVLFGLQQQLRWSALRFSADPATLYQYASRLPIPQGADVLVVEDEETFTFDAEGSVTHTQYLVYKVLTQRGAEEGADVSSSWEPWRGERPNLQARVITPDNVVHVLDPKTITDAPARENQNNIFSDRRVLRAPLPAIAPGSLVEEERISRENAVVSGAGTVQRFYFGRFAIRLVLEAPTSLPLRYELRLLPQVKPQREETNGMVRITFDSGPMNALEEADRKLPSDVPAYPSVVFSTGISWQQVADEYGEIVDRQIASADLRPLVTKLTAGKNARDDKASAILQYLSREIRYTGVEFGNATVVPRSPAETLTRKYGDCKDKASLLVAMLRSAGIPAYLALLKADGEEDVFPDLPGMGMFNHAIVFVPGPPDLWIDATDEYARIGQIPIQDQERLALFARTGSGTLVRTPATSSADNLLIEKREIFLAENGPARIVETSLPHGGAESFYRRNYGDKESKAAQEVLTKHVKSEYLAENLDRIDHSDSSDLSKQFELVLESNRAKRGFTDLNAAVAVIRFDDLFGRLPSELQQAEEQEDSKSAADNNKPRKKRTADWQLDDAFVTEWRYTIVPPAGFRVKPLPPNTKLLLGPAILTEEFAADKDGVVHATVRFDTVKRRMTVSEATEMRNQVALVRTGGPVVIYFEPVGQALLAEGKVQEALQSYHNLIALHPQESIYHLRLAETLLAAGMGETARAEAQAAVKLEPLSALAQRTLADVLEYDLVGRKFRAGSDYSGAEVAFRNAITLDLDDETARGNLAILLEYNHEGVRYGQGAKLKEAIDEYRAITQEKLASLGLANNLAVALFYAGQFADARKSAETLNPQPIALIVACEGALHGAQAAIAEAERRTESKERLREVLKNAGQTLLNLRKYSVAADLLEAGASGDNASQTVGLASALRKARPHEEIQLGNDPASTALQAFFTFTDSNLTLQKLNALYSRNAQLVLKREDPDEVANTLNAGRQLRPSLARSGLPLDVLLDIIVGMPKPAIEGSDDSGYRATLQIPGGKTITMFVVREDSKCKLLDSTDNPSAIGLEVLDRVNANNLDGARVLLDWLREAQHLEGGDDPLAGPAFPRFWTRGKAADAAQMKLAAAAILVQTKATAALGVPILEAARSSATDEASKLNISLALAIGYRGLYDYQKQLAEASELAKQYPESKTVVFAEIYDLVALSRFDDAAKLAEARIQRMPGDVDAMRALALVAVAREDYTRAHELDQKVIDTGKAEASDFNVIAWHALYLGRIDPSDLEYALKATQLSQNNPSILHTLGCVYAEMGKTKEAREVLIQAMDQEGLDEPNPAFWYAFGRIAEQYGIREAAIADYARVTKPNQAIEIPDSSYRLAQLRLQAVRAANDRASASGKKE